MQVSSSNANLYFWGSEMVKKLKNTLSKLVLSAFLQTICSTLCLGQNTNSVRYEITPNIMLQVIEKYPKKKEEVLLRIENEHPKYADIYVDSNRVFEVIRLKSDSILTIRIFQMDKSRLIQLYPEMQTRQEYLDNYADTTIQYTDSTDSRLSCSYIEQNNSFPLTACFIKDSLKLQRPLYIKGAAYPEHQIISNSNHFPIRIIHGNPKAFMTYDFLQTIEYSTALSLAIDAIIKKPKSKGIKKALFDLLSS